MSNIQKWENGSVSFDVSNASLQMNPWLKNYGMDKYTVTGEATGATFAFYNQYEGSYAHGYPATSWLQLALLYGVGLYTAKEQGIVKKGVYFQRYWKAHYFDWLLFARRGTIYGFGGGLILGTILFGDTQTSIRRAFSNYHYWCTMPTPDPRNNETLYFVKQNN